MDALQRLGMRRPGAWTQSGYCGSQGVVFLRAEIEKQKNKANENNPADEDGCHVAHVDVVSSVMIQAAIM
ncbi:hypothetical protein [Candidatus Amarolinea aalborgensis]|uniref:hypothetical protein n=1 Tax=Candidatus Amarolinea aalborgensis TaxID=2249329 RepID=UPI003BFA07D6